MAGRVVGEYRHFPNLSSAQDVSVEKAQPEMYCIFLLKNTGGFRPQDRCQAPLPALQQRQKEQVQWRGALSLKIMCLWIIFEVSLQANGE